MMYMGKSSNASLQALLDVARTKNDPTQYRSGTVYTQLKADFHGKCYLCEDDGMTSIEIEHFEPHKGDLVKKYNWNNLFYSCGHCNNIKGAHFWPLLNCTVSSDLVWESIEIRFKRTPKTDVEVIVTSACGKPLEGQNTRSLLDKIYTGKGGTPMQIDQATNLRKKILRALKDLDEAIATKNLQAIKDATSAKSPFAGMLRWHLKNDFPSVFAKIYCR